MPEYDSTVEYRQIPSFSDNRVGSDGSVWTLKGEHPKLLKHTHTPKGYHFVALRNQDGNFVFKVHRLVLDAFVGPRPAGMECCHNDGNKNNNDISNLRWDTPRSNHADRVRHGFDQRGSKNVSAKLNEEVVIRIRALKRDGHTNRKVASLVGIDRSVVCRIINGKAWAHVS